MALVRSTPCRSISRRLIDMFPPRHFLFSYYFNLLAPFLFQPQPVFCDGREVSLSRKIPSTFVPHRGVARTIRDIPAHNPHAALCLTRLVDVPPLGLSCFTASVSFVRAFVTSLPHLFHSIRHDPELSFFPRVLWVRLYT